MSISHQFSVKVGNAAIPNNQRKSTEKGDGSSERKKIIRGQSSSEEVNERVVERLSSPTTAQTMEANAVIRNATEEAVVGQAAVVTQRSAVATVVKETTTVERSATVVSDVKVVTVTAESLGQRPLSSASIRSQGERLGETNS